MFLLSLADCFQNYFFKDIGSRSGQTESDILLVLVNGSKLFATVISRQQKAAASKERVSVCYIL